MTFTRQHTVAISFVIIGLIILLAGAWCMSTAGINNRFPDVVGTVVEDKDAAKGALKPEEGSVTLADAQVSVRYTDINKQTQQGVLLVMHGDAPKVGEQINVSYDPSHPDIVFIRKHSNAPIYLMVLGAILLVIGGFKLRRLKTPS